MRSMSWMSGADESDGVGCDLLWGAHVLQQEIFEPGPALHTGLVLQVPGVPEGGFRQRRLVFGQLNDRLVELVHEMEVGGKVTARALVDLSLDLSGHVELSERSFADLQHAIQGLLPAAEELHHRLNGEHDLL
eukprot:CAMPEP_0198216100 /NCGR_PEP_ID=MMETSP1445-20131203/54856_1 /TAXON_ID=36898 /ORGANISM="Pyramimonas sp., Strain CCMP2087" /LENGTH=132 /DNA_ID=CAMNT_0043892181 /DNA_START=426 /DNA_END=823 /DNA_ORIENTATION=+